MTNVVQTNYPKFVSTPAINLLIQRAMRYLYAGYSVHLRGPVGTGKTTLALHLANLLGRPILLTFGDNEHKSSDLIGKERGYNNKKIVDNYIRSVVKLEDEFRPIWVDGRLTIACRDGFTLVYDEYNRSPPEVNNVLLSVLEEKLLVLPTDAQQQEYIPVHPQFRVIFTSNPTEYCGVHQTQEALLDRVITMDIPELDELTQQEIVVQKSGLTRTEVSVIVSLVKKFRARTQTTEYSSSVRACLIIAKVCRSNNIPIVVTHTDFQNICTDVLLSGSNLSQNEGGLILKELFQQLAPPTTPVVAPPATPVAVSPTTQVVASPVTQVVAPPATSVAVPSTTQVVAPPTTQVVAPPAAPVAVSPTTQVVAPAVTQVVAPPVTQEVVLPTNEVAVSPTKVSRKRKVKQ